MALALIAPAVLLVRGLRANTLSHAARSGSAIRALLRGAPLRRTLRGVCDRVASAPARVLARLCTPHWLERRACTARATPPPSAAATWAMSSMANARDTTRKSLQIRSFSKWHGACFM